MCTGRSPTATDGEPVRLSTRRPAERIDETNKDTQSFTVPTLRFAGHVSTWNTPSFAEEAFPQNYMVGQPKNQISERHFDIFRVLLPSQDGGPASKQHCFPVLVTLRK